MCGIIGCVVRNPATIMKQIKLIYENQKDRGKDGCGMSIYHSHSNKITRIRKQRIKSIFKKKYFNSLKKNDLVLFHHRLPTSTPNIPECNHPLCNEDKSIHLIHNGWVTNADEQHEKLKANSHKFETEIITQKVYKINNKTYTKKIEGDDEITDSEILVHLLEEFSDGDNYLESIKQVIKVARGSFTFAFMVKKFPKIYLYKGQNGLYIYEDNDNNIFFSSEFLEDKFKLIKKCDNGEIGQLSIQGYEKLGEYSSFEFYDSFGYGSYNSSNNKLSDTELDEDKEDIAEIVKDYCRNHYRIFDRYEIRELLENEFYLNGFEVADKEIDNLADKVFAGI